MASASAAVPRFSAESAITAVLSMKQQTSIPDNTLFIFLPPFYWKYVIAGGPQPSLFQFRSSALRSLVAPADFSVEPFRQEPGDSISRD
jgi:hypothetical protein